MCAADRRWPHLGRHRQLVRGRWRLAPGRLRFAVLLDGEIIGVVTHCTDNGCPNFATRVDHPAFAAALDAPCPQICIGDCGDGNGIVDAVDLLAMLPEWGVNGGCDIAPETPDCVVDIQDLLVLLAAWGRCP